MAYTISSFSFLTPIFGWEPGAVDGFQLSVFSCQFCRKSGIGDKLSVISYQLSAFCRNQTIWNWF